eukprot:g23929.t1
MYPAVRFHGGAVVPEKQGKRCLVSRVPSAQQPPETEIKSMISQEPGHLQRSKHLLILSYFKIATSKPMVFSTQTQALPHFNLGCPAQINHFPPLFP